MLGSLYEHIRHRASGSVRQRHNPLLRLAIQNDNTEMADISRVILKTNAARGVFSCRLSDMTMFRRCFLSYLAALEVIFYQTPDVL